jgi:hypothetical protein
MVYGRPENTDWYVMSLRMLTIAKLAVTVAFILSVGSAGVASASFTTSGTGGPANGAAPPWAVTVDAPSRTLYPGLHATMPFGVKNEGTDQQFLHRITAQFKNDGIGVFDTNTHTYNDACKVSWFEVRTSSLPIAAGGGYIDPGTTMNGSLDVTLDDLFTNQDACRAVAVEVDVTAA